MNDTTPKTRISGDVWDKAAEVADRMGLSTPRQAIEAVFRVYADSYAIGQVPPVPSSPPSPKVAAAAQPKTESLDCAAALDSLLSA